MGIAAAKLRDDVTASGASSRERRVKKKPLAHRNAQEVEEEGGKKGQQRRIENMDKDRLSGSDWQPKSEFWHIQIGIRLLLSNVDGSDHGEVVL